MKVINLLNLSKAELNMTLKEFLMYVTNNHPPLSEINKDDILLIKKDSSYYIGHVIQNETKYFSRFDGFIITDNEIKQVDDYNLEMALCDDKYIVLNNNTDITSIINEIIEYKTDLNNLCVKLMSKGGNYITLHYIYDIGSRKDNFILTPEQASCLSSSLTMNAIRNMCEKQYQTLKEINKRNIEKNSTYNNKIFLVHNPFGNAIYIPLEKFSEKTKSFVVTMNNSFVKVQDEFSIPYETSYLLVADSKMISLIKNQVLDIKNKISKLMNICKSYIK